MDSRGIDTAKDAVILEIRGLTLSKRIFDQIREIRQSEVTVLQKEERLGAWIGYAREYIKGTASSTSMAITWLLAQVDERTIVRVRDSEYFWVLRNRTQSGTADEVQVKLQEELDKLPQIFIV